MATFNGVDQYADLSGLDTTGDRYYFELTLTADLTSAANETYIYDSGAATHNCKFNSSGNFLAQNGNIDQAKIDGVAQTAWVANGTSGAVLGFRHYSQAASTARLFALNNGTAHCPISVSQIVIKDTSSTIIHSFDLSSPSSATINDSVGSAVLTLTGFTFSDTTAPTFSVAPAISSITTSGGTATATIDETGDIYYVVVADGDTAPTPTEVIAGQESGGGAPLASGSATSTTTLSDAFSGLSASTAYDVYFVARDDEGSPNVQASVTKVDFTTATPSPSITNIDTDNDVRAGQTATVNGTNFGSNGNVTAGTLGGEAITVNSNTATTVSVTIPSDIDLKLGTTTNQLSLTVGGSPVTLDNVTLSAPTGYTYVDVSSPDIGSEVYTQYAGGTFVTGDQLVYETETTEDSIGISFAADLQFTLDSTPTVDQSLSVYRIAADGTVDVTDTVTLTAPTSTASGTIVSAMVSNIVSNMVN